MVDVEWSLGVNQFLFELEEIETNTQHISQAFVSYRVESWCGVLERCAVEENIEVTLLTKTKTKRME